MFKETNYSGKDGDYNRESYRYYRDNSGKNNGHKEELDIDEPDDNDVNNTNKEDNTPANGKQNPTKDNNNQARNVDLRPGYKAIKFDCRTLQWNSDRSILRGYITNWQEHLKGIEDTSAIMFLSRCVPSIYRELILSHTQL